MAQPSRRPTSVSSTESRISEALAHRLQELRLTGAEKGQEIAPLQDPLGGNMKPAIAAFSIALLLTGTASAQSQDPAGVSSGSGATTTQTQPSRTPKQPDTRPVDTPKLRDQLLQGAINVLLKPRPRPPQAAPPPVEPVPAVVTEAPGPPREVTVDPIPAVPVPAPAAAQIDPVKPVRPATAPRVEPAAQPAAPPKVAELPAPRPTTAQPTALDPGPLPEVAEVAPSAAAPPAIAAPPAPVERADQTSILAPQPQSPPETLWLILGLFVAAAAAAAVHSRQKRRIARTRAALSLEASLDPLAGACSVSGLALAGPPLAIHARLDMGETHNG